MARKNPKDRRTMARKKPSERRSPGSVDPTDFEKVLPIVERQIDLALLLEEIAEAVRLYGSGWYDPFQAHFDHSLCPSLLREEVEGVVELLLPCKPSQIDSAEKCLAILRSAGVLTTQTIRLDD